MPIPYDIQREREQEWKWEGKRDEMDEEFERILPEHACVCVQVSGCCSAPPFQLEVLESNRPIPGHKYTGKCSQCRDNCDFEPLFESNGITTTWKLVSSGAMGRDSFDRTWEYEFECTECGNEEVTAGERQ